MPRQPQVIVTTEQKQRIIAAARAPNAVIRQVARNYGVSESTLRGWLKQPEQPVARTRLSAAAESGLVDALQYSHETSR